jgi:hypothetical protein
MFFLVGLLPKEDAMLERCFTSRFALPRLADGPAGPFLEGFAGSLLAEGYSLETCRRHLWTAAYLGEWAARRNIVIADLDEQILACFVRHRRGKRRGYDRTPFRAQRFLHYLRETGIVGSHASSSFRSSMVIDLVAWMRGPRGLAKTTIAHTARVAQALLDALGEEPAQWDATGVREFMIGFVRQHAPSSAGLATTCLRCFLRYLTTRGQCSPDLIEAVPKLPTWRMARLPRYLAADCYRACLLMQFAAG